MAAPVERLITCGETQFQEKWVPFFSEPVFERPIVAIANILSLHGDLPGGPHKRGFISVEQLKTCVATRLSAVTGVTIDAAKQRLTPLERNLEINVYFRRIDGFVDSFHECTVFSDLGIPIYHGWKCVPKAPVPVPQDIPVDKFMLEDAAQKSPLTSQEEVFISNTYLETEFTAYGHRSLNGLLQHARNGLCVFYWNCRFRTLYKKGNDLFFLSHRGEWQVMETKKNLIRGPSLGCRQFNVICGGMSYAVFDMVLNCVEECGDHIDLIVINYDNFKTSRDELYKVVDWHYRLRCAGFVGLIVAVVWSDGTEFEKWVQDDVYSEWGIGGMRYVREDCLGDRDDFARVMIPIFEEVVWRREVVYPVEFPANIESFEYLSR